MSHAQLDYHVGILRGYMLALNAPTQVLHAVEILLENYQSKAGPLIGARQEIKLDTRPFHSPDARHLAEKIVEVSTKSPPHDKFDDNPPVEKSYFWTNEQDKLLREMYERGDSVEDISIKINRKPSAIYSRLNAKQIKRVRG